MTKIPWNWMPCWEVYSKKTHKTEGVIILFTKNSFSWKQYNINKTLHLQIIILLDEEVSSLFSPQYNLKNDIRNSVFSVLIGNWSYYLISDPTYLFTYLLTDSLTQGSRVLEKLTVSQLLKKFPTSYGQFVWWGFVGTLSSPQAGTPPLVHCLRLLIQYTHSCLPNWRPFLHPQPEDATCHGDAKTGTLSKSVICIESKISATVSIFTFPTCIF